LERVAFTPNSEIFTPVQIGTRLLFELLFELAFDQHFVGGRDAVAGSKGIQGAAIDPGDLTIVGSVDLAGEFAPLSLLCFARLF
jgi:hypothetical protein